MGLKIAIRNAIRKWEGFVSGLNNDFYQALENCDLCHYRDDMVLLDKCISVQETNEDNLEVLHGSFENMKFNCHKYCPLARQGECCLDLNSSWNALYMGLGLLTGVENFCELTEFQMNMFENIYNTLCELDPEYNCYDKNVTFLERMKKEFTKNE